MKKIILSDKAKKLTYLKDKKELEVTDEIAAIYEAKGYVKKAEQKKKAETKKKDK